MTVTTPFKVPKNVVDRLPAGEREDAAAHLLNKAAGLCALCDRPLPSDGVGIHVDHRDAVMAKAGGPTRLSNLYLSHDSCNRKKSNLPFDLAQKIVRFEVWCEDQTYVTFPMVAQKYVTSPNLSVKVERSGSRILVEFGGTTLDAQVFLDPATATEYFFAEIPVQFIQNDDETQPRVIEMDHVRHLTEDFAIHPVHEPSNCRLVSGAHGLGTLLQFDGQHKTTAQIVLGRSAVPVKVYIDPDVVMLNELVVQIQQGIVKRPLSTSDTMRRFGNVIRTKLKAYTVPAGVPRTEAGFIAAQPLESQKAVTKEFFSALVNAFLEDDSNHLYADFVSPKVPKPLRPMTDRVLVTKLIRPLMSSDLLDENIDMPGYGRDHERANILLVLNELAANMLDDGRWGPQASKLNKRRAENFFYQGSISWWMPQILIPSIRTALMIPEGKKNRMFIHKLSDEQDNRLRLLIKTLASWDIWSTEDPVARQAMRSNTPSRVADAFPAYTNIKLIQQIMGG